MEYLIDLKNFNLERINNLIENNKFNIHQPCGFKDNKNLDHTPLSLILSLDLGEIERNNRF